MRRLDKPEFIGLYQFNIFLSYIHLLQCFFCISISPVLYFHFSGILNIQSEHSFA